MEFMESLYEIENFGIYLFIVIGILVLAFLITLFFGHKDEKKNIDENVEKELPDMNDTFLEESTPVSVEVQDKKEENSINTDKVLFEEAPITPFLDEEKEEEIKVAPTPLDASEKPDIEKTFDFDSLAATISKELDDIEKNVAKREEKKVEPVKPSMPRQEVFSSVYVNRKRETEDVDNSVSMELPKKIDLPKTKE